MNRASFFQVFPFIPRSGTNGQHSRHVLSPCASNALTILNPVLPITEKRPDILIITPQGDVAGFRDSDFEREFQDICKRLEQSDAPQVVVDFDKSEYFGSVIIGAIIKFGGIAQERGGRMVICNASETMVKVLEVSHLESKWPLVSSLREALKQLKAK